MPWVNVFVYGGHGVVNGISLMTVYNIYILILTMNGIINKKKPYDDFWFFILFLKCKYGVLCKILGKVHVTVYFWPSLAFCLIARLGI